MEEKGQLNEDSEGGATQPRVEMGDEEASHALTWGGVAGGASSAFAIGKQLFGRFELIEELGHGGMGSVYRALDLRLGSMVALKTLHPHLAAFPPIVERFRREVLVSRRVAHPNVVTLYDLYEEPPVIGLSMEYLPGGSLQRRWIEQGRPSVEEALRIAREACAGLHAAHTLGILHRDVKPANLLFTAGGQLKVSDFGLARLDDLVGLTTNSVILGTPDYLAPEALERKPLDARTDLYALGIVLYRMLTGALPHSGRTLREALLSRLERAPNPPSSLRPEVPPRLDSIVLRALARNPDERFATCEELMLALEALDKNPAPRIQGRQALVGSGGEGPVAPPALPSAPRSPACPACGLRLLPFFNWCVFCGGGLAARLRAGPWSLRLRGRGRRKSRRGEGPRYEQKAALARLIHQACERPPDSERLNWLLDGLSSAVILEGVDRKSAEEVGEAVAGLGFEVRVRRQWSCLPRGLRYEFGDVNPKMMALTLGIFLCFIQGAWSTLFLSLVPMLPLMFYPFVKANRAPLLPIPPMQAGHPYSTELIEALGQVPGKIESPRIREALIRVFERGVPLWVENPEVGELLERSLGIALETRASAGPGPADVGEERRLYELMRVEGRLDALRRELPEADAGSLHRLASELRLRIEAGARALEELEP